MPHEHAIDGQYLTRSDIVVRAVSGHGDELTIDAALPCPECDQAVEIEFRQVGTVEESDLEVPLDDGEAGLG